MLQLINQHCFLRSLTGFCHPAFHQRKIHQRARRALVLTISLLLLPVLNLNSAVSGVQGINRRLLARAQSVAGDNFKYQAQTAHGAQVLGVSQPSRATLDAVDQGLTTLFDIARRRNYKARLRHQDYVIFIARADRTKDSSGAYSPDIALPAGQYGGSIYDQGGFVYAAGFVAAYTPCALIVAEHSSQLQRLADVVRFEAEHIVLYHNDPQLYRQTADHSRGGGHPILQ